MKLISICVPIYNEQDNIKNLITEIDYLFKGLKSYDYEIIFSDNNSNDDSEYLIKSICNKNKKIKYIRFKKNIGYDFSVFFNLLSSNGEASVVIDCDLQDPIDKIADFLKYWEKGFDLIYGIRIRKNEEDFFFLFRKYYYKILNKFSEKKYPLYAGDFRLIDRRIIRQFNLKNKETIITRCISFDYSKNKFGIPYNRLQRNYGYSKYPFIKSLKYAFNTFILKTYFFEVVFNLINITLIILIFLFFILKMKFALLLNLLFISVIFNIIYIILKKIIIKNHLIKKNKIEVQYKINF